MMNDLAGILGVIFVIAAGLAAWFWPDNTPLVLAIGLFLGGIVLLVAEALLPTHGILGIAGLLCFGGVIGVCFYANRWFGLAVFGGAVLASPFLGDLALRAWMKSPIGKRLILQSESPASASETRNGIALGSLGVAVTEMRPIGECDFGDQRLEAASELGIIPAGKKVKVIAVVNGRPTVRVAET